MINKNILRICNVAAAAIARAEQRAIIDQLLLAWADISGLAGMMDGHDPDNYRMCYNPSGSIRREENQHIPGLGRYLYQIMQAAKIPLDLC
jgi:hypothetical protein